MKQNDPTTISPVGSVNADSCLTSLEILRYSRHLIMPEVGTTGQRRLKKARVLVVGAGGLGSPASMYLAAAGVGTIGIVDFDSVDLSNLQRQILHSTGDVGRPKLESAGETLGRINPHLTFVPHATRLTSENALDILKDYDVIVDGTDNFPTRYLINDATVMLGKPNVYGSIFRFDGQITVFSTDEGPCYRCLYPAPPPPGLVPGCAEGGVLGVLPGIVGTLQALEAMKLILGCGETLAGRLLLFDALQLRFRELRVEKNRNCAVCGDSPQITTLIDYDEFCGIPASREPVQGSSITVEELKARRDRGDEIVILDVREPYEHAIANIGGELIPLQQLRERMDELDKSRETVVHCKSGARSEIAAGVLRQAGFQKVWNLVGGIDAWSERIDPCLPRY